MDNKVREISEKVFHCLQDGMLGCYTVYVYTCEHSHFSQLFRILFNFSNTNRVPGTFPRIISEIITTLSGYLFSDKT